MDAEPWNDHANGHQNGSLWGATNEMRAQMERLLGSFGQRLSRDEKILSFAEGRQVTVRYELNDVKLSFYTSFDQGAVRCGVGEPPEKPQVTLKMKADILDKLFTGRENGPKAAMSGKLSFTGDTIKGMSLQRIQRISIASTLKREPIGNLDALFERSRTRLHRAIRRLRRPLRGGSRGVVADAGQIVGDIRGEIIRTVEEMYANGLITSTGGNVSARIPGKDELWITPNSSFKGASRRHVGARRFRGKPDRRFPYALSSERMLHCAVYRNNPIVGAVIHSHAPKATILGLAASHSCRFRRRPHSSARFPRPIHHARNH